MSPNLPVDFLNGVTTDFVDSEGDSLVSRWNRHADWLNGRLSYGIDPYSKAIVSSIGPTARAEMRGGGGIAGVNFASQDYLGLASHPAVHEAAKRAMNAFGVHSAGSAALMGNTKLSVELEQRFAEFLGYRDCTIFPTGWGAGYGLIRTLVRADDHVIIDVLAHACLQEGARAATGNIHLVPHLSTEGVRRRLERIRKKVPRAGVLVVTESVFSMDSDVPDLRGLQALCREYRATLLVDVAHDLGALGMRGLGYVDDARLTGEIDILMGSFSKTFASNGGFVACNNPALKLALRYNCGPLTFTNALSPVQCAIVLACLEVIASDEGRERRENLMKNILHMRAALEARGFDLLGQPSAIVPVLLGDNPFCRLMTKYTLESGGIVNLVEYPAVARNTCRWRLQLMATHEPSHIDELIAIACRARDRANSEFRGQTDVATACAD